MIFGAEDSAMLCALMMMTIRKALKLYHFRQIRIIYVCLLKLRERAQTHSPFKTSFKLYGIITYIYSFFKSFFKKSENFRFLLLSFALIWGIILDVINNMKSKGVLFSVQTGGSCATGCHEPCQAGNRAALSGSFCAPQ